LLVLEALKGVNLLVAFLLELAMLVAFVVWAMSLELAPWLRWGTAVLLVVLAVTIWGIWAAPRSDLRLSGLALVLLQAALFSLAVLALVGARQQVWAIAFAVVAAVNLALAAVWGQEDAARG
jgi:hypothetical protein